MSLKSSILKYFLFICFVCLVIFTLRFYSFVWPLLLQDRIFYFLSYILCLKKYIFKEEENTAVPTYLPF